MKNDYLEYDMQLEDLKHYFGEWVSLQRYRLEQFKIVPGTREAWDMTLGFIKAMPDLKDPYDVFGNDDQVNAWLDEHDTHWLFTLWGGYGCGKTHLAVGAGIWRLEHRRQMVVYFQVGDLLRQIRESYRREDNIGDTLLKRCRKCELLILDDLGMEKPTDWAHETLDTLIDYRYVEELDTIVTTNLDLAETHGRIASRLSEGEVVHINAGDYRKVIAGQRMKQRMERKHLDVELSAILKTKKSV